VSTATAGEEFLLALLEQTLDTALVAVERVRSGVERLVIPRQLLVPVALMLGAGIAALGPDAAPTAGELLKQADAALYRAKSAGRIQIALADGQTADGSPSQLDR
jgi:diguanylate cyclase (GGDEF)-like protein